MIELNLNVEMHWDPTFEVGRHCLGYRSPITKCPKRFSYHTQKIHSIAYGSIDPVLE